MSVEKKTKINSDWLIGYRMKLYSALGKGEAAVCELLKAEFSAVSAELLRKSADVDAPMFSALSALCNEHSTEVIFCCSAAELCNEAAANRYMRQGVTDCAVVPAYRGGLPNLFILLLFMRKPSFSEEQLSALNETAAALGMKLDGQSFGGDNPGDAFVRQSATPLYVIDKDFSIKYFNKALGDEFSAVRQGEKCYKALMGGNEQCQLCPIKKLANGKSNAVTLLTDRHERMIVVTADAMRFNGENMYGIAVKKINSDPYMQNSDIISQFLNDNVYNGVLCGYWETDIPFYMINKPMLEYLGYSSSNEFSQAVGGLTINAVHPDDREKAMSEMNAQLKDFHEYSVTIRMLKKDGSVVWTRSRGRSISDKTGKNIVVGIFTDISELISANERLDKLINTIPGAVVTFSVENSRITIEYCSDGIEQILGITAAEYSERFSGGLDNLIYPPDRAHVSEVFELCERTRKPHSASYRVAGNNGRLVWIRAFCCMVDRLGDKAVYNAVLNNLSTLERSYVQLLDATASPILISDIKNGQLLYANKAMYKYAGVSENEADDIKCAKLLRGMDIPCDDCAADRLDGGTVRRLAEINGITYDIQQFAVEWNGRAASAEHLTDVSAVTEASRRAEALAERLCQREQALSAALRHAGLRYWEYEYNNDRVIRYDRETNSEYVAYENFPEELLRKGGIHKDDCDSYREAALSVKHGADNVEWSGRYPVDETGGYVWRRVRYSQIYDTNGKPVKAMVTSEDIDAFKELEERMNNLLDQHNIASWQYDILGGRLCNVRSKSWEMTSRLENMRIPPDKIEIIAGFVHPDDVPRMIKFYEKARCGEKNYSTQLRIRTGSDNEYGWFEYVFTNVFDDNGKPLYALCSSSDIGALKQLEKQYADEIVFRCQHFADDVLNSRVNLTENRVLSLLANGRNIFTADKGTLTDYRKRMGLLLDDIELSDGDNEYLSVANLRKLYKNGIREIRKEYMARLRSTGGMCHIKLLCRMLLQPQTENIIAFFYNRDDTESYMKNLVTQTIIESDFNMCAVLSLRTEELIIIRADNNWSNDNRGLTFTMFVKDIYARMIDSESYESGDMLTSEKLEQMLSSSGEFKHELYVRGANNEKRLIQITYRYADRENGIVAFFIRDIHDFMQSELEKKRLLMNALSEAKKANAAKSDFLSRMSHDMRTPMNAVLGLTHLSENEQSLQKLHDNIRQIQLSGSFLLNLINDTLDMSKIESGVLALHPTVCGGEDIFGNIIAMMKPLMSSRSVNFTYSLDSVDGRYFLMDAQRLEQIIVNFLSNSAKFTPSGGSVSFTMRQLSADDKTERYRFCVSDTGIGMSEEFLKHVFEPFAQEHRAETEAIGGTGLGMPIAKQLIELMGGTLKLNSEYGNGTKITFELDLSVAEKPAEQAEQNTLDISLLNGKRVLLCEDNAINEIIATELLAKKGVQVESAMNGKLGVEKLEASPKGYYDAVLMDIRMPVMDGLTAAREIRGLARADAAVIPIIAMTANAFDDDVNGSFEAGMNAHVAKPIDPEKLYATLIGAIEK